MKSRAVRTVLACVLGAASLGAVFAGHRLFLPHDVTTEDVFYIYREGQRLLAGKDPYVRVLEGDMRNNAAKYATYFPGFYLLSAATQAAGLRDFGRWIYFWRYVFLLFAVGVAWLLAYAFVRRGRYLLAAFAALFWLLNRWTLHVADIAHIDFLPIFFLVWSLIEFDARPRRSLVLFGVSLALKQVAIWLVPLYLIWVWQRAPARKWRTTAGALVMMAAVPLAISLPFLLWHAQGFVCSIMFSLTRTVTGHFAAPSMDYILGIDGLTARLLMLGVVALVYVCAARGHLGRYAAALFAMAVFVDFNLILFRQYLAWITPLLLLTLLDWLDAASVRGGRRSPATAGGA